MSTPFLLNVAPRHHGVDLYTFLDAHFPFWDSRDWPQVLATGQVRVDEVLVAGNLVLCAGQCVALRLQNYCEAPVNTQWQLYWQNEDLLAVYKPANLSVQRTTRNIYNTLTAMVRRDLQLPEAQPLHRLDLETAGIVLLAKTKCAALHWQPRLNSLLVRKVYRALVWGQPAWRHQTFTCRLATQAHSPIRCQMYVNHPAEQPVGKLSQSRFMVLRSLNTPNGWVSELECELFTGRKHQLRAQLAHLGHPIVGDKIYSHQGSYYLKRLANTLSPCDEVQLASPHHLLVACAVLLQLDDDSSTMLRIPVGQFPAAWQRLVA